MSITNDDENQNKGNIVLYAGEWSNTPGVNNAAIRIYRLSDGNSQAEIPNLTVTNIKGYTNEGTPSSMTFAQLKSAVDNTQKISYISTSGLEGYTMVDGELKINGNSGAKAGLTLIDNDTSGTSITVTAEKLATWNNAIQKYANGETIIGGKLSGKGGSKVGDITFDDDGKISGLQDINNGFVKIQPAATDSTKTAFQINGVLELNDNTLGSARTATLTLDGLTKLNNLVSGSSTSTVIKVGDDSEVGGVKFSNSALDKVKSIKSGFDGIDIAFSKDPSTNWNNTTTIESTLSVSEKIAVGSYGNVAINAGEANQVKIGEEGIVVGKNSTVIGSDGVYAGGHTEATAKAVLNADGSIKGASDGAGNYKFSVDGQTGDVWSKGSITANAAGFNNLNVSGGAWIGDTTSRVQIGGGGIIATNGTDSVTIGNGAIVATGAITAKTLNVENIVLGGSMYNKDGTLINGNLSIGSDGHLRAANGNFDVKTDGSFTNNVGNTTLKTTDGKATIANGNASIDVKNGSITDKVGNTTVETKDGSFSVKGKDGKGMDIDTSTGKTTFTGASGTTTIDGNTITTGKLITDDIEIKGSGISLSQIGQLGKLDSELTSRQEYNNTAVGAINAEAAARREDINRLNDSLVAETTARIDDVNRLDQSITDEVNTRKDEVARLDNSISGLRKDINDVSNRVDKVGAMAAAIASLKTMGYDPQAPSEFSVGLGHYKGETGVALGFFHYPNKNFMINVSLSTAGGETMGGIGATWRFGHKSPQKLLDEQRAAQAKHF